MDLKRVRDWVSIRSVPLLMVMVSMGCRHEATPSDAPSAEERKSVPLRVLVVDDPLLATALERLWRARAEGEIILSQRNSGELVELDEPRLGVDAIIYPSGLLGELATRRWITSITDEQLDDPRLAMRDIFPIQRLAEIRWGTQVYAVPFGSPTWTLLYRRDLFDQLGVSPPETWREYFELASRLADPTVAGAIVEEGKSWSGAVEPLGAGWAGQVLLGRAAAYARHRNQFSTLFDVRTMEPLVSGPPFVRALEELVAATEVGSLDATVLSPADARRAFTEGRCAMALSWPSQAPAAERGAPSRVDAGFAELPGAVEVFNFRAGDWETRQEDEPSRVTLLGIAGRIGSVTRECRRPHEVLALLTFFAGVELGHVAAPASDFTTAYRESQLATISGWIGSQWGAAAAQQYGEVVRSAQSQPHWLHSIRIPGRARYLETLDRGVHRAVRGEAEPQAALQEVADDWREITVSLGRDQQQQAYTRSLGLEP